MDYNLPTDLNTSSTLADVAPILYGQNIGTQQQQQQDNMSSLQNAFAANEQFQQQKRPADLNELVARTQQTNANAGYLSALARGSNLTSDEKQATMPGSIVATNAKNAASSADSRVQELESHAAAGAQVYAQLKGLPDNTPGFVVAQVVRNALGPLMPNDPRIDKAISQMLPGEAADRFKTVAEQSYAASTAARAATQKEGAEQKRTETQVAGQLAAATIGATSREAIANQRYSLQALLNKAELSKDYGAQASAAQKYQELETLQAQQASAAGNQAEAQTHQEQAAFYAAKANAAHVMDLKTKAAAAATVKPGAVDAANLVGVAPANSSGAITPPAAAVPPGSVPLPPGPQASAPAVPGVNAKPTAQQSAVPAPTGRVRIFDPRTGQAHTVPQAQMEEAMKQGYQPF